jgi:penicillin amidase
VLDPEQGFFVTANNDLNAHATPGVAAINMPMGSYRADRIAAVLARSSDLSPRDVQSLQYDLYSLQAEQFMKILRPLLPDSEPGRVLRDWDCRYELDSVGAFLFEAFYRILWRQIIGRGGLGDAVVAHLDEETGIYADFYANFDRILLAEQSAWFGGVARDDCYRAALDRAFRIAPKPWGDANQIDLTNILFQGRLPRWLGFDRGPIKIPGGRATVHQGQVYRSGDRTTSFIPSFHMVTDLASDSILTNLVGGPSDRRFSRWYNSGTAGWRAGAYKGIEGAIGSRESGMESG